MFLNALFMPSNIGCPCASQTVFTDSHASFQYFPIRLKNGAIPSDHTESKISLTSPNTSVSVPSA